MIVACFYLWFCYSDDTGAEHRADAQRQRIKNMAQGLVLDYYTNGGKKDNALNKYFDMPETVTRGGKPVNIAEHNARILGKRK